MNKQKTVATIQAHVQTALNTIFKQHPVIERVILYGSRAKHTHHAGSDIDLCIVSARIELKEFYMIDNQIDDLLLPWKVDLTVEKWIKNTALLEHIQRVGVLVYPEIIPP